MLASFPGAVSQCLHMYILNSLYSNFNSYSCHCIFLVRQVENNFPQCLHSAGCQGMTDLGVLIWSLSVCLHSNHAQRWCWEKSYHWHYLHVSAIRTLPSFGNGAVLTCVCLHQLTTILISLPFSPVNVVCCSSTYAFKSLGPIADISVMTLHDVTSGNVLGT